MITKNPHKFANKQMKVGDEYQATKKEARLLSALGWAECKQETIESAPALIEIVEVPQETEQQYWENKGAAKKKRRYRRKDMKAED